jgi:DNA-binding NarL/FixJ family response regulator
MPVRSIRVLIVEDYEPFQSVVASILQKQPELQIICKVSDGLEAVQKAAELQPDLILLDIGLPSLNGIEVARQIRKLSRNSKILFVSQESSADVVQGALGTGAQGYVLKIGAGRELLEGVNAVLRAEQFVSSSLKGYEFTETAGGELPHRHEVQFYSDDALLLDTYAGFIAVALKSGRAAIAIISQSHSHGILSRLKAQGLDIDAATQLGTYVQLDASKMLAAFMVNGMPDTARFFPVVGGLIEAAAKAARQQDHGVVVCGECSPHLWAEGKADAAIRVEQLFDELGKTFGMDILCGYALSSFHDKEDEHVFQRICAEHSAVHGQELGR